MKKLLRATIANLIWWTWAALKTRAWRRSTTNIQDTQTRLLLDIVQTNAYTLFGEKHDFQNIQAVADFQRLVPVCTYDDLRPYIDRVARGEDMVLTAAPVQRFGISSGTTMASKLIPYPSTLIEDFRKAINPWAFHLFLHHPSLLFGSSYWSVTPIGCAAQRSEGGIPIGFDDDRSYVDPLTRWILGAITPLPAALAQLEDMDTFRRATLRLLIQEEHLRWVSIWNPTFLSLLVDPLADLLDELIVELKTGGFYLPTDTPNELRQKLRRFARKDRRRAQKLRAMQSAWKQGTLKTTLYEAIWPRLRFISCWAHGSAGSALPHISTLFPSAMIEPKGLIATEAFVSFPFSGAESALTATSHFYEFEDMTTSDRPIMLAHELRVGRRYGVIVTTSGGLYRYRLNDVIEVTGFYHDCPLLHFVGKAEKVVDIRGEKLNESFVQAELTQLFLELRLHAAFWMLAPHQTQNTAARYVLYLQIPTHEEKCLPVLTTELEAALRRNFHYDYCRRLGQLKTCAIFLISSETKVYEDYLSHCVALGQRLGNIKPTALHPADGWEQVFAGRFL